MTSLEHHFLSWRDILRNNIKVQSRASSLIVAADSLCFRITRNLITLEGKEATESKEKQLRHHRRAKCYKALISATLLPLFYKFLIFPVKRKNSTLQDEEFFFFFFFLGICFLSLYFRVNKVIHPGRQTYFVNYPLSIYYIISSGFIWHIHKSACQ